MNLTVVVIHEAPHNQSKSFMWSDSNDADIYNYLNPLFKIATVCICLLRQEKKMGPLTYLLSNLNEVHIRSLLLYFDELRNTHFVHQLMLIYQGLFRIPAIHYFKHVFHPMYFNLMFVPTCDTIFCNVWCYIHSCSCIKHV